MLKTNAFTQIGCAHHDSVLTARKKHAKEGQKKERRQERAYKSKIHLKLPVRVQRLAVGQRFLVTGQQ